MSDEYKIKMNMEVLDKLNAISKRLNISVNELIERYIRRGLYIDDYYEPPRRTREELIEMCKKDVEKDLKNGILPKKHNFDIFVGRWNKN